MERIKERDDIMRDERSFERNNAEVNGENTIEGAGRTIEDKTALSDFDTIAESISNKIDEDAADVMEEAIKEIAADSAETGAQGTANRASASANTDNSYGTDAKRNFSGSEDTAMHNSANPGSRTDKDGVSGTMPPEQNNGNINAGGSIPNSAVNNGWNYNQQYYGNAQGYMQQGQYQQGYNYNMPPYRQQNGYNGTQGAQPGGVYNQQMYNMPQNPYGYGQYGYYAPPYYQQNVPGGGYNNYGQYPQRPPQNGMNNGQAAPYGANNPQAQTSGKNSSGNGMTGGAGQANQNGQYSPNYQQSGWYNNYGGYNQNVPPYYGYQYPYQPYGNYNQAYGAGYNANAARAASANRTIAQRGKVKKQKPKNVGLRVFVCILAVVILAGITLTGAYFVLSPIDENVLDNPPVSSYSTGSSRIEASAPSDFSGGQSVDVPINSLPEAEQMSTSEIAEKIMPSVVGIVTYSPDSASATSLATGIIITEDGYIATNDHIYDGIPNAEFVVITSDNKRYDADFVAGDSRSDLAVLKMKNASGLKCAEFGDSDNVKVGEEVVVIGNPYSMTLSGSVTKGIISATNRRITGNSTYTMKLIQTDAAINPGNSGGPLVNSYGQIIGINSSKIQQTGYEGIGFAIPSATVKTTVESLIEHGYVVDRAKLGITFQVIDFLAAERNNLPQGLYVLSVSQESGLSEKIYESEIITHLDGVSLSETVDFMDIIEAKKPGDTLTIRVYNSSTNMYRDVEAVLTEDRGTSSYKSTY